MFPWNEPGVGLLIPSRGRCKREGGGVGGGGEYLRNGMALVELPGEAMLSGHK